MARKYTAQEMREMATEAEVIEVADQFSGHDMDTIAAMLRQAADDLEREEKRKREYEYGLMSTCSREINVFPSMEVANKVASDFKGLLETVRREVGEWEKA